MNTNETLIAARKLIENERDWFGGYGRDSSRAGACAAVAIYRTGASDHYAVSIYLMNVNGLFEQPTPLRRKALYDFNDSHTHAEVLALFDRAIIATERAKSALIHEAVVRYPSALPNGVCPATVNV